MTELNLEKVQEEKEICFVIMPFGGWFDEYYSVIYKPAIESCGLISIRADDLYTPGSIMKDVWKLSNSATIVLAELTGRNPNVLYELGIVHALSKPAVLITENIEDIPFDLRALRIIEYNKNHPNWGESLKDRLYHAIEKTLRSPASTVLQEFYNLKSNNLEKIIEFTKQDIDLQSMRREINYLRADLISKDNEKIGESHRGTKIPSRKEVNATIKGYLQWGLSPTEIKEKLLGRGVPPGYIDNQLSKACKKIIEKDSK